jgi:hypothetical protein
MLTIRRLLFCCSTVFLTIAGFCQNSPQVAPVPPDSLELVTGSAQVPTTPEQRTQVMELLERARQNSDLHAPGSPAFTMRVGFSASGNVLYTGSGEMEETWVAPLSFRWTARLGDFTLTRISVRRNVFDDRHVEFIPLRLHMLRDALFWPVHADQEHALLRTASANWRGKEVTCILTSGGMADPKPTPGRRWEEREYCVDPKSGLLQMMSDAPGIYVLYDYDDAVKFHGRSVARKFSIVEGGRTVLEAHLDSIAEAEANGPDVLTPTAEMRNQRSGPILSAAMRFPQVIRVAPGASMIQPVIVHAILGRDGKVLDAELVENSEAALTQSALDLVKRTTYTKEREGARLQREAFINVKFVSE